MNRQTARLLEQHFDTAFAAPDGIAKLRELILTLAMQGRLVEQDPSDPPASELLKEIQAEKQQLVKAGKIKKPKPLPPIKPEEVPYELPKGWEWVRLGNIGDTNIGLTYSPSDVSEAGIPVLRSNNIQNGMLDFTDLKRVNMDVKESVIVQQGDLLICARNGSRALVGKTALIKDLTEKMAFGAFMAIFRSQVNSYLLYFINSSLFRRMIDEVNTMTINQITQNNLKKTICPLPPLPEQHRIVARIDQLMARCDELETLHKEQEEKRLAIHAAAINQLLDAPDGSAWNFIQQHFDELYTVKENVAELRKAILQLAVMGRLVPQNSDDPPASELLKEIKAEKQRLVKAGKIKKSKPLPPIKPEEVPFELPQGWEWVMVQDAFNITSGTTFKASLERENGEYAYVKVRDMNLPGNEFNIITSSRFVDPDEKMLRSLIPTGSIIFPKRGGAIATNKKRVICDPVFVDLNIMAISPMDGVLTAYAYRWLLSVDLATLNTGTSVPQINHKDIDPLLFPLPPLPEQHRIVAKIDQLMAMCDTLEQQIDASTVKQSEILNAVMARVGG